MYIMYIYVYILNHFHIDVLKPLGSNSTENSRRRFQAAFSPVSDPSKYLAPALYGSKV